MFRIVKYQNVFGKYGTCIIYKQNEELSKQKINVLANICVLKERAELIEILVFQHSD